MEPSPAGVVDQIIDGLINNLGDDSPSSAIRVLESSMLEDEEEITIKINVDLGDCSAKVRTTLSREHFTAMSDDLLLLDATILIIGDNVRRSLEESRNA